MSFIKKLNDLISRIETYLLVFVVLVMVAMAFLQVVLRNVFDEGILWGDIFLRHLVLWVGFIGASLATQEEKHINVDVFTRFAKGRSKFIFKGIIYLFSAFVCWLLLDASWQFVLEEIEYKTMLFAEIPSWYMQIIIPVGFGLMTFRFALLGLENSIKLFAGKEQAA